MKHPIRHAVLYSLWRMCSRQRTHNSFTFALYTKLRKKLYKPKRWPQTARIVGEEYAYRVREAQTHLLHKLKERNKPVRVCFTVIYDSVFQAEPLFEKMLSDAQFSPFILVIPDTARGKKNELFQLKKTYDTLSAKYGEYVHNSWDTEKKRYKDYSDDIDIVCTANPYDSMTHPLYRIEQLCWKTIPIFFNYAYPNDHYSYEHIASAMPLSLMWKYFTESAAVTDVFKQHMINKGANLVTVGYIKMDRLANQTIHPRTRKSIIIAPHHSVADPHKNVYAISTFLQHADFFKNLPAQYPDVDFIFRPHPLLYTTLMKDNVWGEAKTKAYFAEIQKHENLIWQNGGDYFETFANADAMIHDCGSYVSEYVYTNKPMCFLLSHESNIDRFFMSTGANILRNSYLAYSSDDIKHFIDEVVINGNDSKKELRDKVRKSVMTNYPHATDFALRDIKHSLSEC